MVTTVPFHFNIEVTLTRVSLSPNHDDDHHHHHREEGSAKPSLEDELKRSASTPMAALSPPIVEQQEASPVETAIVSPTVV
jgi:hypothetical protein